MKAALNRRLLGVAALSLVASVTLAACGGAASSGSNQLGTIAPGQLKLAFRSDDKPTSFVENGKPAGFLIELTEAMAKKMRLEPSYVATDFASMLPNVRNHTYDSAAFGTLVTPPRQEVTDFTKPVSFGQAQLISRKAAALATVDSAAGKTVAVTRGSELIPLLKEKVPTIQIKEFPNIAASANGLTAGQVDGLFTGTATTSQLLSQHPAFTATEAITTAQTAFPVAKDRGPLKKALDDALTAVIADGTYTALFDKWNPPGMLIPQELLNAYPGMAQRPAHGGS
ncbi:ABC transporter substrate-binding protein [Amycolatopsis alkalitolerans]|uniref:Amino acid ABC transporter substrate-binding protein n=1 Tax=Amycolatopsis alkalitolerans TaxID=2547244 RepID=A0A5C4MC59_9PSEU|nr:transporter substrate-binding domain-containing protein [Amycolatopsis alkalitolerans]TNC29732.1 amino acid ABC transporter substrate-binding protein [Amycolatopsis alkalitolerans]